MAGAGYKLFNTGDVLTAAQVNTYLQQQTVMVFADSSARTTALSGVLAEGMMSYLQDTNAVEVYNGSAWVGVSSDQIPLTTKGDLLTYSTTDTRLGVGTDGQVLTADSTQSTGLKWATPSTGITWKRVLTGDGTRINEVAYNGSNLWVAVGNSGKLLTSSDAQTWTSRTSGFGANTILGIAYGNGIWVAVGGNGTLTTSTDGITWTSRTANVASNQLQQVVYANSLFVAVGRGGGTTNTGGIIYSTDGITWTRKSQSLTVGANYWDVTWNGTNWVVVADLSTNNYLYASTPSGTWTVGSDGSSQGLKAIWWDGTRHTVGTDTQGIRYSTSTTLGTTTYQQYIYGWLPLDRTSQGIKYYNGKLYGSNELYYYVYTPASSSYARTDGNYSLAPSLYQAGGFPSMSNNGYVLWAGASGIIIACGDGSIFTSF